ncbi:CLUMA_CG013431, isoform A [Clunio marinus]|uniref:CLUMA_CG013431, isoform A n=1 Tax=Clunio marinus TaxID=568069 RepID=A0A1J1IIV4_9DIPT|nr:CLUMA_CG013431, isoform A [Clunio marinus]
MKMCTNLSALVWNNFCFMLFSIKLFQFRNLLRITICCFRLMQKDSKEGNIFTGIFIETQFNFEARKARKLQQSTKLRNNLLFLNVNVMETNNRKNYY